MKTLIRIAIFGAICLSAYFGNVAYQTHLGEKTLAATGLEHLSLEEAFIKAAAENKTVLADLSAIWCPGCRNLDQNVFSDESVKAAILEKYVFARIEYETDEGAAFMTKYQVRGFPTLLILDAQGNKLRKLDNIPEPKAFLAQL